MNRLFLVLLIFPLIFISCEKDDENQNNNNLSESILGTWRVNNYTNYNDSGYIDPSTGDEIITYTEEWSGPAEGQESYAVFTDDNFMFQFEYYNDTLDYVDTVNYIQNENIIVVITEYEDEDVDSTTLTITELTDTYLNYNLLGYDNIYTEDDTTLFDRVYGSGTLIKSTLPSLVNQDSQNNKSVRRSRSFINKKMGDK